MVIPDVSGSTIPAGTVSSSAQIVNYGIFATTGSNQFIGNQAIDGTLTITNKIIGSQSLFLQPNANDFRYLEIYNTSPADTHITASGGELFLGNDETYVLVNTNANQKLVVIRGDEKIVASGSLDISGSLTASLAQGFTYVGNAAGRTRLVATSSFGGVISVQDEGTILGNATSFNFNGAGVTATLSAGTASISISGGTGSVINTGSFATTGSNFFVGIQSINNVPGTAVGEVYLLGRSGSLFIANQLSAAGGPSYASISHISSSQLNANTNLIFKDNSLTGSTIVSGSGNIFSNPTDAAAGRVNYIGGTTNLFLNGQSDQLPTITGSAASVSGNRPTMNGNIINGTSTWTINQAVNPGSHTYSNNILAGAGTYTFNTTGNTGTVNVNHNLGLSSTLTLNSPSRSIAEINAGASGSNALTIQNNTIQGTFTYNGPVSSSTHTITQNSIAGTYTLNVQSQSRAITSTGNIINGTLTYTDNTFNAGAIGSTNTISNNNINGTATFTLAGSSSFSALNNNLNTVTITSFLDASAVTNAVNRLSTLNANAIFGNNNSILFSGSMGAAPTGRTISANLIAGQFISASLIGDGSGSNMFGTAILGGGLNVIGTTTIPAAGIQQNYGSAFFGRWNAEDGNRARTAQTIFAVGTGTSGSAGTIRKTGFLIDSGSNSYFEGSLNVSGSTSLTGSLTIQSGSAFFANGNRQFNVGAFSSLVSQSGSANVSQSMNFETTDISSGVSIASNSRITLANSGTYNLQFSAQVDRVSGSGTDVIYIWLKKNGTNVSNTAGAVTVTGGASAAKVLAAWNYVVDAVANDYYELCWQSADANIVLTAIAASGNIPLVPSIILTVTQVR